MSDYYQKVCQNMQMEGLCHPPMPVQGISAVAVPIQPLQTGVDSVYSENVACEDKRVPVATCMLEQLACLEELAEAVANEAILRLSPVLNKSYMLDQTEKDCPEEQWPPLFDDVRRRANAVERHLRDMRAAINAVEL
jgi:hypothetical protein